MRAAIVGAGDLGGAIAAAVAVRDCCREIQLIDEASSVAEGKALDIQQAGAVHRSVARLSGTGDLGAVSSADVVIVADRPGGPGRDWAGEAGLGLLRRVAELNRRAPLVCAGTLQDWLVERAVAELDLPWTRIVGSAPVALEAAVRSLVALEAGTSAAKVGLVLAGRAPDDLIIGWEGATVDGVPATTRLTPPALARLSRQVTFLWPPGPIALAAAAALVADGLLRGAHHPHHALVALALPGLDGRRAVIAATRLGPGRVADAVLAELAPQARVTLGNLLAR